MGRVNRIFTIFIVSLLCLGCDQLSKALISNNLPKDQVYHYFYDVIRIVYVENSGVFLGLGNQLTEEMRFLCFVVLVSLFLAGLLAYLLMKEGQHYLSVIGYSLIFSGGLSNLIDRAVHHGAVIDFINVGISTLRTGIFNVADVAILIGVCLVLYLTKTNEHTSNA